MNFNRRSATSDINLRGALLMLLILIAGCDQESKITDPDLIHVLSITNCDSLLNDEVFKKNSQMLWPKQKPTSVLEAVLKLDTMTNDYNEHCFKICDPTEFYFGFGMGIRNEWVHQGTEELRTELYEKLKIGHPDFTSGIILYLYGQYIGEGRVIVVDSLGEDMKHDTMKTALQHYVKIEESLSDLKKARK